MTNMNIAWCGAKRGWPVHVNNGPCKLHSVRDRRSQQAGLAVAGRKDGASCVSAGRLDVSNGKIGVLLYCRIAYLQRYFFSESSSIFILM